MVVRDAATREKPALSSAGAPDARPNRSSRAMGGQDDQNAGSNYQVRALERALDILDAFTLATPEMTITRLAERVGLPKSTVIRLASILVDRRYLERVPASESLRIGVRTFEIGSIYIQTTSLEAEARPIMAGLADETGQTANLGILDRGELVHIAIAPPDRPLRYWATIGKREDAHYTGLGKVLLAALSEEQLDEHLASRVLARRTEMTITDPGELRAELARVRRQGYAIDDEESNVGLRCVAAPVIDRAGATTAAVSISGSTAEFTDAVLPRYIAAVVRAGGDISLRLGSGTLAPAGGEAVARG
jgi:DNA-binding IclR family transcriptional regulator